MTEKGEAGQPQGRCPSCGAEVRPGNAFCISCGASLTPRTEEREPTYSGAELSGRLAPFIGATWAAFQRAAQRLRGAPEALSGATLRGMPRRTIRWFKDLPLPKAVLAGLILLVLLVLLSPLALFATLLAFGVSLITLIVQARQRRSTGRWPIVGVASLVLVFVFAGISNALYGTEFLGSTDSSSGEGTTSRSSHATSGPNYFVAESTPGQFEGDRMVGLNIFSDSLHREDLRGIAEDVIEAEENTGLVVATVYDSDSAIYDPDVRGHAKPRNPRGQLEMGAIFINFSIDENWGEPKKGYYKVVEYCASPQDCDYTYPIE